MEQSIHPRNRPSFQDAWRKVHGAPCRKQNTSKARSKERTALTRKAITEHLSRHPRDARSAGHLAKVAA